MEMIKGVEEFFLRAFFAANKLNIIDQQYICLAIFGAKLIGTLVANGANQLVRKLLRRAVDHAITLLAQAIADGIEQVCFAQPDTPIDEERVEGLSWRVDNGKRGSMGQAVVVAHNEGLEGMI